MRTVKKIKKGCGKALDGWGAKDKDRISCGKYLCKDCLEKIELYDLGRKEALEEEFEFLGMVLEQIPNNMMFASIIGTLGERRKTIRNLETRSEKDG